MPSVGPMNWIMVSSLSERFRGAVSQYLITLTGALVGGLQLRPDKPGERPVRHVQTPSGHSCARDAPSKG